MLKIAIPTSFQRVLVGMMFGFVLGVVLYQSSRVQMETPNVVQAEDPDPCKYPANGSSCPVGTTLQGGDCVRADGASCVLDSGEGTSGICTGGACAPNPSSVSSVSCNPDPVLCTNACSTGPLSECRHVDGSIGCFQDYRNSDCTITAHACTCPAQCCNVATGQCQDV